MGVSAEAVEAVGAHCVSTFFYFLWSNVTYAKLRRYRTRQNKKADVANVEVVLLGRGGARGHVQRRRAVCPPQRPFFSTMTGTWRRRRGLVGPQRAPSATPTSKRRDAVVAVMSSPGPPCRYDRHGPLPAPPRRRGTVSPLRVSCSPLPAAT